MFFKTAADGSRRFTFGVRAKLLLSYSLISLTTLAACFIGFYSFSIIERSIGKITDESIPGMTSAMALAQSSGAFETTVPLLSTAKSEGERQALNQMLNKQIDSILKLAQEIGDSTKIYSTTSQLNNILQKLDIAAGERIGSKSAVDKNIQRMTELQSTLNKNLSSALDDASFDLELAAEDVQSNSLNALDQLVNHSLVRLKAALNLKSDINTLLMVMTTAAVTDQSQVLTKQRDTADILIKNIFNQRNMIELQQIEPELDQMIDEFINVQSGITRLFNVRSDELNGIAVSNSAQRILGDSFAQLPQVIEGLATVIDNVYFELVMSAETVEAASTDGIPQLMDPGFSGLRLLLEYRANSNRLVGVLSEAAQLNSIDLLVPIGERFQGIEATLSDSLESLELLDGGSSNVEIIREIIELGSAQDGIFAMKRSELDARAKFNEGLGSAKSVLTQFLDIINNHVNISKQAVTTASTDSLAAIQLSKNLLGVFAGGSLVATILLVWLLVSRNILRRLITVINALQEVSEGKLDSKIKVSGRDELSELAKMVDIFREKTLDNNRLREQEEVAAASRLKQEQNTRQMETEQRQAIEDSQRLELEKAEREKLQSVTLIEETDALLQVVRAASGGNLTKEITVHGEHPTGQLAEGLDTLIKSFTQVMNQITRTTQIVATGTEEIVSGNSLLSQRTIQQTSSLEATSASMLVITKAVNQNFSSATSANELANQAQSRTQEVSHIVTQAVGAMNDINDSSAKVTAIVGVIDEIAFQTNLLALNAAVEAARAGEQGRGFAVVASEVRELAGRSGHAAREIKTLIEDSVKKIDHGVKLVGRSEKTLEELLDAVKQVTNIVEEISVNAGHQAKGIETVNDAVSVLDKMTEQNKIMVDQATICSTRMDEQTTILEDQLGFFIFNSIEENPTVSASVPKAA